MAKLRINFGVSDFLRAWIKTQPNVVATAEESATHFTIEHNMTSQQLATFKTNVQNRLTEDVT